jgi:hypothetical protein
MFKPIAIVTEEFERRIAQIRRHHVQAAWSVIGLHVGHESAIARVELVKLVRFKIGKPNYSERSVRKLCEIIREAGIPICSDRYGYWIGTPTETLQWATWYRAHAFTMLMIAGRLVRSARDMTDDADLRHKAAKMADEIQLTLSLDGDHAENTR